MLELLPSPEACVTSFCRSCLNRSQLLGMFRMQQAARSWRYSCSCCSHLLVLSAGNRMAMQILFAGVVMPEELGQRSSENALAAQSYSVMRADDIAKLCYVLSRRTLDVPRLPDKVPARSQSYAAITDLWTALQLINVALDISSLFEKRADVVRRHTRFTSREQPTSIILNLEHATQRLGGSVQHRDATRYSQIVAQPHTGF